MQQAYLNQLNHNSEEALSLQKEQGQIGAQNARDMGAALNNGVQGAVNSYYAGQKRRADQHTQDLKDQMSEEDLAKAQRENAYESGNSSSEEDASNFAADKRAGRAKIAAEADKFTAEAEKARSKDNTPKQANVWHTVPKAKGKNGYAVQQNEATGEVREMNGIYPEVEPKAPNEVALKASGHLARAVAADQGYSQLTEPQVDPQSGTTKPPVYDPTGQMAGTQAAAAQMPLIGSYFKNDSNAKARQYEDDFLAAEAREDITRMNPETLEFNRKTYFPQKGDTPQVRENKAASRKRVIEQIRAEAAGAPPVAQIAATQIPKKKPGKSGTATGAPAEKSADDMNEAELDAWLATHGGK